MPSTKSVAARIPMEDYVKFQKEAVERKMTMNDYMIMRIYSFKSPEEIKKAENEAAAVKALKAKEAAAKKAAIIEPADLILTQILGSATDMVKIYKSSEKLSAAERKDLAKWEGIAADIALKLVNKKPAARAAKKPTIPRKTTAKKSPTAEKKP